MSLARHHGARLRADDPGGRRVGRHAAVAAGQEAAVEARHVSARAADVLVHLGQRLGPLERQRAQRSSVRLDNLGTSQRCQYHRSSRLSIQVDSERKHW